MITISSLFLQIVAWACHIKKQFDLDLFFSQIKNYILIRNCFHCYKRIYCCLSDITLSCDISKMTTVFLRVLFGTCCLFLAVSAWDLPSLFERDLANNKNSKTKYVLFQISVFINMVSIWNYFPLIFLSTIISIWLIQPALCCDILHASRGIRKCKMRSDFFWPCTILKRTICKAKKAITL